MQQYKRDFLEFAISAGVLRFGEFTLKSGRVSPYFFNAGLFNHGAQLARLGRYYAAAIVESGIEFDLLYGPAYKGIPLAAVTATYLAEEHNLDIPFAFNRKEVKDHGAIVGGAVLDFIFTAGKYITLDLGIIMFLTIGAIKICSSIREIF